MTSCLWSIGDSMPVRQGGDALLSTGKRTRRQAPLIVLSLLSQLLLAQFLLVVNGFAADHYHVRAATYACVDRRAVFSSNPAARAHGRCFRVTPGQRLERVSPARHALILLRVDPPIPGEPPLYFRTRSLTGRGAPVSSRQRLRQIGRARAQAATPAVETATQSTDYVPPFRPAPILAIPLPAISLPASHPVRPHPVLPAPASIAPVIPPAARPAARTPPAITRGAPASEPHASRIALFGPLLLWLVIIAAAMLLVRLMLARASRRERQSKRENLEPRMTPLWQPAAGPPVSPPVSPPPGPLPRRPDKPVDTAVTLPTPRAAGHAGRPPGAEAVSMSDYKARCVERLRHAGWDARTRFSAGLPGPDVIARNNGLVLALQCHPWSKPVDVEAVEDACMIRERQHSDLAAIVASSSFTDAARQLAARTGIVLLHEDELASFAA